MNWSSQQPQQLAAEASSKTAKEESIQKIAITIFTWLVNQIYWLQLLYGRMDGRMHEWTNDRAKESEHLTTMYARCK